MDEGNFVYFWCYMKLKKLWETYFFKKRYIMSYHDIKHPSINVFFKSMDDPDIDCLMSRVNVDFYRYLMIRKNDPAWVVFYYEINNTVLGYSFLHAPLKTEWNDSLPTNNREARVSTDFIYPEYRGRGILGEITKCQIKYAHENNLKLWCVIEASNSLAMKASYRYKSIDKLNFLIKFFSRNVISITINPFRFYILLGNKRAKR